MSEQIITLINNSVLTNVDYKKIIHHCESFIKDEEEDDEELEEEDELDYQTEYVNGKYGYLGQFVTGIKSYFDCLSYIIQQHIELTFEDFSCSCSYDGDDEGSGNYNIKIIYNKTNIFRYYGDNVHSFKEKDIENCKIYKKNFIQKITDEYGYDNNVLLICDIYQLFIDLITDDYIVRNSDNNAIEHF